MFQALNVPCSDEETEALENSCGSWCPERPQSTWIDDEKDTEPQEDDSNDESDGVSTAWSIVESYVRMIALRFEFKQMMLCEIVTESDRQRY